MKTLFKLLITACFTFAVIGNSFGGDEKMTKKDHIMMKDGKVWVQQDGKVSELEKDLTLENGTVVKTDGTVTAKDGESMTLKNGDAINMKGKVLKDHVKGDKDKNDKEKDSKEAKPNANTGSGDQDKRGDTKPE